MKYPRAVPGAKVVCVYVGEWEGWRGEPCTPDGPNAGEVCTISSVLFDDGVLWLTLSEYDQEDEFHHESFRPLITQTQEQDVEMFRKIADQAGVPA